MRTRPLLPEPNVFLQEQLCTWKLSLSFLTPLHLEGSGSPAQLSSLFLIRFILDDSAIYLSNKCDVETGNLRKGNAWLPLGVLS